MAVTIDKRPVHVPAVACKIIIAADGVDITLDGHYYHDDNGGWVGVDVEDGEAAAIVEALS